MPLDILGSCHKATYQLDVIRSSGSSTTPGTYIIILFGSTVTVTRNS